MSENLFIKTENFANDYNLEDSNNDTNSLSYKTTKLVNFTNMGNVIKGNEEDLDKMEEFLAENVDESSIDIIKKEDVDEMDEFLPEDSPSIHSPSTLTWKSDDRTEATNSHDKHVAQQHLTDTITQQISVPKLEIIDVRKEEQNSKGPDINGDTGARSSANKRRSIISTSRVAQKPIDHKCDLCGSSYTEFNNLRRHIRYKHPLSINAEYICEICNQSFSTQTSLKSHTYWKHPESQTPTKHKCEICDTYYIESKNLRVHIRRRHPSLIDSQYVCKICSQRFNTQRGLDTHSYLKHAETQPPAEHKCEICGSCYVRLYALREHMKKKHPSSIDLKYMCEICNRRFTTQIGLDKHSNLMHPIAKTRARHKCEMCDNSFLEMGDLRRHIRKRHPSSIDTEYICEICNQRFTTSRGLHKHSYWMHQGAHSTQMPTKYNCEQCDRSFKEECKLRIHMRKSHPFSIDTEYICNKCNGRFATQYALEVHSCRWHSTS
ncbi:uncharacterized protein [Musca autumnalis]|uniref:uncharacterized protein n=1 Tax=Musca autumnalis TaxID=221902 RepID=UPI003CEAE607